MIYVKMRAPSYIVLHYHGEGAEPCDDYVIDNEDGHSGGVFIQGIFESQFEDFKKRWEGKYDIITEAEVKEFEMNVPAASSQEVH